MASKEIKDPNSVDGEEKVGTHLVTVCIIFSILFGKAYVPPWIENYFITGDFGYSPQKFTTKFIRLL